MKNLVYKELKLSINKFFFVLPLLLACLMFIPQWIYTIVFMYFFWITVTNMYSSYQSQLDYSFCSMLPVSKKDIVTSKVVSFLIVEGLHVLFGLIFGIIHNLIYGSTNFLLDINYAFFGLILVMFSIFNIVFLPMYFKTGYFFGKPVITGIIVTFIYAIIIEYGTFQFAFMRNTFEGTTSTQIIVLVIGILLSVGLNWLALIISRKNFESIS